MPLKLQRIANVDVYYQEKYPDNFDGVLRDTAYWYPHPFDSLPIVGEHSNLEYKELVPWPTTKESDDGTEVTVPIGSTRKSKKEKTKEVVTL